MKNIRNQLSKWAEEIEESLKSKEEKICNAIKSGQFDLIKYLIEQYDLEPTEKMLNTAVYFGQLETVKLLVEKYELVLTKEMLRDALIRGHEELANYIWTY
jgi:hypothetical protein